MFANKLQTLLIAAVRAAFAVDIMPVVELPKQPEHGDYATPVAMGLAKTLKQNPRTIAEQIIAALPSNKLIASAKIAGAGFINFKLTDAKLVTAALTATELGRVVTPRRIVLDFSHPNIAKPLHFGHFRGTILGQALVNIWREVGHEVLADNFLGNWGTNFGKLIVAIEKWGDDAAIKANPTTELVALYQRFHRELETDEALGTEAAAVFAQLERDGESSPHWAQWQWIVEVTLAEVQQFYDRLGTRFDVIRGEQFYEQFIGEILSEMLANGVAREGDGGALVVDFDELPTAIIRKADGATLYHSRDLARLKYYREQGFDSIYITTGSDHLLHFRQLFAMAEQLGWKADYQHLNYGMVRLPEGKLSTRAGRTIDLMEVIDTAQAKTLEKLAEHESELVGAAREQLAETLAIGALKFNDLGQNRTTDIIFDWQKMLDFQGYSGPFVQYSAVRCASILRKAGEFTPQGELDLSEPSARRLAFVLAQFAPSVHTAAEHAAPHHIAQYLFELASQFNRFYAQCPILTAETDELRAQRLTLTAQVGEVLRGGLGLLGIDVPERM